MGASVVKSSQEATEVEHPPPSSSASISYQNKEENDEFLAMEDGILKVDHGHPTSPPPIVESHARSVIKGLSWRFLATSTTCLIAWLITGEIQAALQIGFMEFFAKLFIYYVHERIWTRIHL